MAQREQEHRMLIQYTDGGTVFSCVACGRKLIAGPDGLQIIDHGDFYARHVGFGSFQLADRTPAAPTMPTIEIESRSPQTEPKKPGPKKPFDPDLWKGFWADNGDVKLC